MLSPALISRAARLLDACAGRPRTTMAGLFLLGLAVRLPLIVKTAQLGYPETVNIAVSVLEHGSYADAFGPGSGTSAHCMPGHPLLVASVLAVFGKGYAAGLALGVLASAAISLTFALLPALGVACGLGFRAGLLAGIAGALVPVNYWAQTHGCFDASFTALAAVLALILIGRMWRGENASPIASGVVFAVGILLNALLMSVLAALAAFSWRRWRRYWLPAGVIAGAILLPWVVRNYLTFGEIILTRSNFGLELAASNNPYVGPNLDRNMAVYASHELHPFSSKRERELVRTMGEPAYSRMRRDQAIQWISADWSRFVRLAGARIWNLAFPRMHRPWQTGIEAIITIGAILGLLMRSKLRTMFLATFIGYCWVFLLVQSGARYRLPLEPLMLLLGAYAATQAWSRWSCGPGR